MKRSGNYNPGHNILELYNILVQIRFTTSKRKLDNQYSKLGTRVASRVAERLKTCRKSQRHSYRSFAVTVAKYLRTPFFKEHLRMTASICNDMKHKLSSEFMSINLGSYTFTRAAVFPKTTQLKCHVFISSRLEVFYKKAAPKIFTKLTGKNLKNASTIGVYL